MAKVNFKIKIVDVSTDNKDRFLPLIPGEKRLYLDCAGSFCLGAVMDNGTKALPVGVLIFSIRPARHNSDDYSCTIQLQWFYVALAFRNRGIATRLYETFLSSVPGHARIKIALSTSSSHDELYNCLLSYGFSFRLEEYFELSLSAGEIADNKKLSRLSPDTDNVISLDELAPEVWNLLSDELLSLDLSTAKKDYDPTLSSVLMDKDVPIALSLIKRSASGKIYPVLFKSIKHHDDVSLDPLLSYTVDTLTYLPIGTTVVIKPRSGKTGALIDTFFSKKTPALARVGYMDI